MCEAFGRSLFRSKFQLLQHSSPISQQAITTMPGRTTYEINLSSSSETDSPVLVKKAQSTGTSTAPREDEGDDWSFSSQPESSITARNIQVDASRLSSSKKTPRRGRMSSSSSGKKNSNSSTRRRPRTTRPRLEILADGDDKAEKQESGNKTKQSRRQQPVLHNKASVATAAKTGSRRRQLPPSNSKSRKAREGSRQPPKVAAANTRANGRNKNYYSYGDDGESSASLSDSENEIPYTQNLKIPDDHRRELRRQMAALADSDDEDDDEQAYRRKEPIRPGDVISYYHPTSIYGDSAGYRVTQVLGTNKTADDGCLDLDNGEFLPADTSVRRVGEFRRGRVFAHLGVAREIKQFRLRTRRLTRAASGLERQVARLKQTVLEAQEELRQVPEHVRQMKTGDDDGGEVSPVGQADLSGEESQQANTADQRANKPNHNEESETKKDEKAHDGDSSSDDSLIKEYLEQAKRSAKSAPSIVQEASAAPLKENLSNSQQSNNSSIHDSPFVSSQSSVKSNTATSTGKLGETKSKSSTFSLTRVSQGRPPLSTVHSKQSKPKEPSTQKCDSLDDSLLASDDSEDEMLMQPVFSDKKSASTPNTASRGTRPAASSVSSPHTTVGMSSVATKPSQSSFVSERSPSSRPPRPPSSSRGVARHSFGVKDKAQRRALAWSESSPTIQQAEGEALDTSDDDDDVLSITSTNRCLRHRASVQNKKRRKSSDGKKKAKKMRKKESSPPKDSPPTRPSIFRPTEVERANHHVYGDLPSSSDDESARKPPRYRNPLTLCDDGIESFRPAQSKNKTRTWLQNMHAKSRARSQQSGAMRLSFEPVKHTNH